ncbi:hypothetical protein [Nocardioides mesophilus]|uniref:Uncharacterized protein n=1 Tax=Nocardioides mesophilus TaxID=433659 RepID=A0A7G9RG74_9ACTN|nr:hypothetical protein [Nocardioides mesophilus]QNN54599.1 hypothetical protein H9L09_10000 [Nocardioides mesophilus]
MTSELGRLVVSDLRYLQRQWSSVDRLEEDNLRRDSATLRRLLIDNGNGLLTNYWKSLGHKGQIKVTTVDMRAYLEGVDLKALQFAGAGGARNGGAQVSATLVSSKVLTEEEIRNRYERATDGPPTRTSTLSTFLDSTGIRVAGVAVSRRNIIQFVGNRLGGVHFDETRGHAKAHVAEQFAALDSAVEMKVADLNAIYFELLSIGQSVLDSEQVQELMLD